MRKTAFLLFTLLVLCLLPSAMLAEDTGNLQLMVYQDTNNNGELGAREAGLQGAEVLLLDAAENEVGQLTTGEDGLALFSNLPAGEYHARVTLPEDYGFNQAGKGKDDYSSVTDIITEGVQDTPVVTVAAGQTSLVGIAAGKMIYVSGVCWLDESADGIRDDNEAKVSGVRIRLVGQKNGLEYETTSDEDGNWKVIRVRPGFYTLTAYVPDGLMFTKYTKNGKGKRSIFTDDGVSKASKTIDTNDKKPLTNQNIGFVQSASISGICFLDANYNGLYDEGEQPLAGVKMVAIKQATAEDVCSDISDENGAFCLTGLRGNTYKIRALLPDDGSDFTCVSEDPAGNQFKSREDRREYYLMDFELQDQEQRTLVVGAIYPATVSGVVYFDQNFSGSRDSSERVSSGNWVRLLNAQGEVIAKDKTDVKGRYSFADLTPGLYSLQVVVNTGYALTKLGENNVFLNSTIEGEGYTETFSLELGQTLSGQDAGMIKPGYVQGTVFADLNDNGLQDAGEGGLEGTTVRLLDENGEVQFTTEISWNGSFLFDAVLPGTYTVEYTLPEKGVFAKCVSGGNTVTGENGTGSTDSFSLQSGEAVTLPLCGALLLGKISGALYADEDGNGLQDAADAAVTGVTISLIPSRSDLEPLTVTTDENGAFALTDLHPDTWQMDIHWPDGYVTGRTDGLQLPLTPGNATESFSLKLSMGESMTAQQIGICIPASLEGQLWLDENNNGLFDDGEAMVEGCEIHVTDEINGKAYATLLTDENGAFRAEQLIPGSYALSINLDENSTAPKAGDSAFTEEDGALVLKNICLKGNEQRTGIVAGLVRYTTVSGKAWLANGENVEGLAGVEIQLLSEDGDVWNTISDDDGTYAFTGLMPGTYSLSASVPEGYILAEIPEAQKVSGTVLAYFDGRQGSSDTFELKMSQDLTQMYIGCLLPGKLGDFCWLDENGNGLQDSDEPGVPGVQIRLMRDGEAIAETVSDQYGFYWFRDIYPTTYTLQVVAPEEVVPTTKRDDIAVLRSSLLEDASGETFETEAFTVPSAKANFNVDLGFVCKKKGVYPAGLNEGETQNWVFSK